MISRSNYWKRWKLLTQTEISNTTKATIILSWLIWPWKKADIAENTIEISKHAFKRMKERAIKLLDVENTIKHWEMFEYINTGIRKTWYYDKNKNIFVWIKDMVTTVIKPTKNYINNLKNTLWK